MARVKVAVAFPKHQGTGVSLSRKWFDVQETLGVLFDYGEKGEDGILFLSKRITHTDAKRFITRFSMQSKYYNNYCKINDKKVQIKVIQPALKG